ncbi:MAG TPA: DUF2892 domain-containing protein [Chryseolinea sp.]|nr:DUF2892 domain-containing protein [Chryseolinea sp.]
MKKNMGAVDRIVRVTIAFVIIGLYVSGAISGTLSIMLIALSGIFVITSLVGVCPLYLPLGITTLRKKLASKH